MFLKEMDQFIEIIDKIKIVLQKYEERKLNDKYYRLYLANNFNFKYLIPNNRIPHLLGVDTAYLLSTGFFNSTNSYQILKQLCSQSYKFSGMIKDGKMTLKNIFSKYVNEKIDNFFDNIKININDTDFVCKYDKNKSINQGITPRDCDYIICKQIDDGTILELDLKIDKNNNAYPISNRSFSDGYEADISFKELFNEQDITLINCLNIKNDEFDSGKKIYLNETEKYNHVLGLENCRLKYNCNIDITYDYRYLLKKIHNQKQEKANNCDIITSIIKCIIKGIPITESLLNINSTENLSKDMLNLIDTLNDRVITNKNYQNDKGQEAYSQLQIQIKNLKEANKVLKEENNNLTKDLNNTKNELNNINESYQKSLKFISNVKEALDKF